MPQVMALTRAQHAMVRGMLLGMPMRAEQWPESMAKPLRTFLAI